MLNDHDVEAAWASHCKTVYTIATEFLGPTVRKHKDLFDENCTEIQQLLEEKHHAYRAHINDPQSTAKKDALRNIHSNMQSKLHQMQDTWLSNKADEIQGFADSLDKNNLYAGLKEAYGPTTSGTSPLLSTDGSTLITDKEKILERWAKHFNSVLNHPSAINDNAINRLPQVPINDTVDAVPTLKGTQKAICQLSSGKEPGSDAIPAEVYKDSGMALVEKLQQLFTLIWHNETAPKDFKDASIMHPCKYKENRQA